MQIVLEKFENILCKETRAITRGDERTPTAPCQELDPCYKVSTCSDLQWFLY